MAGQNHRGSIRDVGRYRGTSTTDFTDFTDVFRVGKIRCRMGSLHLRWHKRRDHETTRVCGERQCRRYEHRRSATFRRRSFKTLQDWRW
jgi:hypothetical protein